MNDLSETIIHHYQRHAHDWDADRRGSGWNDRTWHDRFLARLRNGATVLDLGCGGGSPVANHLAAQGISVTGVDSSPRLIALCRERLPDQAWIVSDIRDLKLAKTFDGILAWDSFFHLSPGAQRAMFPVFAAHAHQDTVLMFKPDRRSAKRSAAIAAIRSTMRASIPASTTNCSPRMVSTGRSG